MAFDVSAAPALVKRETVSGLSLGLKSRAAARTNVERRRNLLARLLQLRVRGLVPLRRRAVQHAVNHRPSRRIFCLVRRAMGKTTQTARI